MCLIIVLLFYIVSAEHWYRPIFPINQWQGLMFVLQLHPADYSSEAVLSTALVDCFYISQIACLFFFMCKKDLLNAVWSFFDYICANLIDSSDK